ncbi:MAG: hypothetical protein AAGJ08_16410 [Cyanobacteria bacterium P01_H01_bin.35]
MTKPIIVYQDKAKRVNGIIEYLILQKPSTSAILATLVMALFITAITLSFIGTEAVTANNSKTTETEILNNN